MQKVNYVRLYADEQGESHFEDIEVELPLVDFAPPAGPLNFAPFLPVKQSQLIGFPVGWAGDANHPTPSRMLFCVLKGEFHVTASDGTSRRFPVGSLLLQEDTWGKGHSSRIIGEVEGLIFAVTLADTGEA